MIGRRPEPPPQDDPQRPLMEHLAELTRAIKRAAAVLLLGFVAGWVFREELTDFFKAPLAQSLAAGAVKIVATKITDVFTIHMKLASLFGLLLTMPYLLLETWWFIVPGLHRHERRFASSFFIAGLACFIAGGAFAYFFALPRAFDFLVSYSTTAGTDIDLYLSLYEHVRLVTSIITAFGILFEIPLLMVLSCIVGLVDPDWFARKRGPAIIVLAILSAVFTPPDLMSMILMLVPLVIFYEAAILLARLLSRRKTH